MNKNTKIIILALVTSVILFLILMFWIDSRNILNYIGISATIVGFVLTLFLLNMVTDISKAFMSFKENEIFHNEVLQRLIKDLEEIVDMSNQLLSNKKFDDVSIRQKFCSNISDPELFTKTSKSFREVDVSAFRRDFYFT